MQTVANSKQQPLLVTCQMSCSSSLSVCLSIPSFTLKPPNSSPLIRHPSSHSSHQLQFFLHQQHDPLAFAWAVGNMRWVQSQDSHSH